MQLFFTSRTAQRNFKGQGKKVDNGAHAAPGRRWGVELNRSQG